MTQPQIRLATKEDLSSLIDLWAYCFNDGDTFQNWYFKYYYRQEECIVASVDGVPVASLQVIDLPTHVGEQSLAAGYIVGVDCLPEYRGQGLTRCLMEEAIERFAPDKGYQLLHLMPFEADFYEPFGFVFGNYHANMQLAIDEFYRTAYREAAQTHHWKNVDLNEWVQEMSTLEAIYVQSLKWSDGYVARTNSRRWSALLDDVRMENGHLKLLYNEANEAVGYFIYLLRDDDLMVREMQAVNAKARQAMYYFIASHRSQVKTVTWSAAETEPIVFNRKKDKQGVKLEPFMMHLIVDPAIIGHFASRLPQNDLYFYVEQRGLYRWAADSVNVEAVAGEKSNHAYFTLHTLTQMVFDRSNWFFEEADDSQKQIAALFKEKKQIFNNEYF